MDYIRDTIDGQIMPAILGYTSTVFGATAAITRLRGASAEMTSHAIAIAAANSPEFAPVVVGARPNCDDQVHDGWPITQVALMSAFTRSSATPVTREFLMTSSSGIPGS